MMRHFGFRQKCAYVGQKAADYAQASGLPTDPSARRKHASPIQSPFGTDRSDSAFWAIGDKVQELTKQLALCANRVAHSLAHSQVGLQMQMPEVLAHCSAPGQGRVSCESESKSSFA